MKINREDLEQRFKLVADEELIRRVESGDLTELAHDVAARELRRRGLSITDAAEVSTPENEHGDVPYGEDLVEVARVLTPTEAHILQARLQAEGIPAVVADAHLVQAHFLLALAVGGVRVLVPESFLRAALEVKAAVARGDYTLAEDDDAEKTP